MARKSKPIPMNAVADQVQQHLRPLIGLPLSVTRRTADLRNFQFGEMKAVGIGTVGEWALHIQCPWRIEGPQGIVTGRSDLWKPAVIHGDVDWDSWDYEKGNLQDKRIFDLLGGLDPEPRSYSNTTGSLIVESVTADDFGGAAIHLSGGYRLVLFPAGSEGEDWRVFRPATGEPHFVISGGTVETD